jgi:hypothetical protein
MRRKNGYNSTLFAPGALEVALVVLVVVTTGVVAFELVFPIQVYFACFVNTLPQNGYRLSDVAYYI